MQYCYGAVGLIEVKPPPAIFQHSTLLGLLLALLILHGFNLLPDVDLYYRRDAILQGGWWRLLSGQLVHSNHWHLLLNVLALCALYALAAPRPAAVRLLCLLLGIAALTSLLLLLAEPQLQRYAGLSGALHGAFFLLAIRLISMRDKLGYLLIVGLIVKLAWEQLLPETNAAISALINDRIAVEAHFWGAVAGLLLSPLVFFSPSRQERQEKR